MNNRLSVLAALVGVAAAIVVGLVAFGGDGSSSRAKPVAKDEPVALLRGIPQHGIRLGDPKARVLLVEYADPQCPFCREFAVRTWPSIVRDYVRTGKVRMELRLFPFLGPDSVKAAKALVAAGLQDRLWEASAKFYAKQGQENSGYVTDAFLRDVMTGVPGLDPARALRDMDAPSVQQELGAANTLRSRYAVTRTPTLLVGRDALSLHNVAEQTPSPEQIGAVLDQELAKTR